MLNFLKIIALQREFLIRLDLQRKSSRVLYYYAFTDTLMCIY